MNLVFLLFRPSDDCFVPQLVPPLCECPSHTRVQHVWDLRRQQQCVERDCDSVAAQQRRFRDEIRHKQQQVPCALLTQLFLHFCAHT